ncbi:MAG: hypothetical protein DI537_19105 [Stutzerimonas stutzeri]|nr:MAG: hypothetical protein DI537_19105 [Stutzerimonas stutzeri]
MAVKKTFEFKLGDEVSLQSGESGTVIGRAHYLDMNPQYMVRYTAADGRLTECWWAESALTAVYT